MCETTYPAPRGPLLFRALAANRNNQRQRAKSEPLYLPAINDLEMLEQYTDILTDDNRLL